MLGTPAATATVTDNVDSSPIATLIAAAVAQGASSPANASATAPDGQTLLGLASASASASAQGSVRALAGGNAPSAADGLDAALAALDPAPFASRNPTPAASATTAGPLAQ